MIPALSHWVLIADQMGYDDYDVVLGVFETREAAFAGLVEYLAAALARHPSNRARFNDYFSATHWDGLTEGERWEKRGHAPWRRIEVTQ